jgi:hypothetical protein
MSCRLTICVLPLLVTIKALCEQAGISRQWLNQLVDLGEVPGVVRKENGRLQITANPDLGRWVAWKRDLKEKRELKRDELKARKTAVPSPENGTSFTSKELALQIGCTISSIHQRVLTIPGAYFDESSRRFWDAEKKKWRVEHTQYRFTDTPELKRWISEERAIKNPAGKKTVSLARITEKPAFLKIGKRINVTYVDAVRLFRREPVETWGVEEIKALMHDLNGILRMYDLLSGELAKRAKN